jgi:hypothetical protein
MSCSVLMKGFCRHKIENYRVCHVREGASLPTRKTKELDHEKLVTVFLGPLSDSHWLYLYMEIVARRTRRTTKATDTDLYIFISDGEHVFGCSVEQTDHSVNKDCLWRIEEISHRTDSLSS